METIGARVRREREAQGLSRQDLGRAVGMGYSTLAELERGGMQTSTKLHLIAEALGVSVRWLETGKGAKAVPRPAPASHAAGLDVGKLADLLATVEAAVEKAGVTVPARVRARLVATLYADEEASAAASAQAVQAALVGILATMETSTNEPTSAR
jgi:transcriptional regulator with XRE-family HTH domain